MPRSEPAGCQGTNRNGEPCKARKQIDKPFCWIHEDPSRVTPIQHPPPDERRCTATATGGTTRPERKGERCDAWAMQGQTVCEKHGGGARQNRIAGARRVAEAKLLAKAANLVGTPVENPLTELAALAGRARAWMDLMQDRVDVLLAASNPANDVADTEGGIRYRAGAGEQLRAEVQLYERAMDRLGKFLADYGRLNIDERLAKIEESKADVILKAIDAALAHAGVVGTRATEAKRVAARHLRAA